MEWQPTQPDEYKELNRQLAYEWASVELPGVDFTYTEYIKILGSLSLAVRDGECTKRIFRAILDQAVELGKSSLWVEREVRFETLAQAIGRSELLAIELKHAPVVNDQTLDLYNDRVRRFTSITEN